MGDLRDNTSEVSLSLGEVELSQLGWTLLADLHRAAHNTAWSTTTLSSNHATHGNWVLDRYKCKSPSGCNLHITRGVSGSSEMRSKGEEAGRPETTESIGHNLCAHNAAKALLHTVQ
jgi:hypothetical protein